MPTPAVGSTIKYSDVTTEFTLSVNPPPRAIGADFRFASGTYTPASPAIPTGATATISLSGDLGGRTKGTLPPLYSFDNFLFTSSNVSGQTGPTLANFQAPPVPFYNPSGPANTSPGIPPGFFSNVAAQPWFASYWSLYGGKPGYQQWTVPETATYAVIAAGAPGASWSYTGTNNAKYNNKGSKFGGKAAVVAGPFNFTQGQQLVITVGQTAQDLYIVANPGNNIYTIPGRGGGGCTAIVDAANTSVPILVAGGGGGTCSTNGTVGYNGGQGNKSFYINKSAVASAAGTDGSGGDNCAGAGFGANSGNSTPAQSWANGFVGGSNGYATNPSYGGFGGGGAGGLQTGVQTKGGGGGGYIGGNGAGGQPLVTTTQINSGGFGGTSYCTVSSNAAATPIYGLFYGEGNGSGNAQPSLGAIPAGYCWIKKITPLVTNFTITFTDMGGYAYDPYLQDGINYWNGGGGTLPVLYYATNPLGYNSFQSWLASAIATNAAFNYTCPTWYAFQPGLIAWVVPNTGNYKISAAGGGGDYSYNSAVGGARNPGGRGRLITATYSLNIGDVLIMAVGQRAFGGGNSNSVGANANLGWAGGGGATMVMRNGLISANNTLSATLPGFPLIYAAGGSGGSTLFAGTDASSTDITGTTTPGNSQVGPSGGASIAGGAAFLFGPGARNSALFSASDFIANSDYVIGYGGSVGGAWPGGGRGGTTTSGGGAGWNGALGSTATVACGAATSYYWSGAGYVAASYTGGYNAAVVSGSGTTGGGYVTIQQL